MIDTTTTKNVQKLDDIAELEIPLVKSAELSLEYGANVSFLDGSIFPTGTIKDLRNAVNIMRDRGRQVPILYHHITSGNSGASLAALASIERRTTGRDIETFCIVPQGYGNLRADLEKLGSVVTEKDLSAFIADKEIADMSRQGLATRHVNPGMFEIKDISTRRSQGSGYSRLGSEIMRQNPDVDIIFVPYGSGETGLGIYNFYRAKFDECAISKIPNVVFVEIEGKKEIEGKNLTEDKTRTKYVAFEDRVNELVTIGEAARLVVTEAERDREYRFLTSLGIKVEKTSALSFAGARKYGLRKEDNAVILNSGQGRTYQRTM